MNATTNAGQNGRPQENDEVTLMMTAMASPTARTGETDDRPRPISDSPADTSSPSAGNSNQSRQ